MQRSSSFDQCGLYSSPILDAVRSHNRFALEREIHRLVRWCVQANLPLGSTILKVIETNREYCSVCIPGELAWLDRALNEIFEQSAAGQGGAQPALRFAHPSSVASAHQVAFAR